MRHSVSVFALLGAIGLGGGAIIAFAAGPSAPSATSFDAEIASHTQAMLSDGKKIFRYDTFGSEAFWGDALQLHKAILGAKNGGVGPGVSPKTALSVGLKVDADALPKSLKEQLKAGKVDLDDPATTVALLKLNAVVGVTAFANPDGSVTRRLLLPRASLAPARAHMLCAIFRSPSAKRSDLLPAPDGARELPWPGRALLCPLQTESQLGPAQICFGQ